MKYKNKNTNKVISEMAKRRGKKLGKSGERIGSLDNTIAQQSGHGTLRRSSEIAKGKVANIGDKIENITDVKKISLKATKKRIHNLVKAGKLSPEAARIMIEKIEKSNLSESTTVKFFKDGGELKVSYNSNEMDIKEFLRKSKVDADINSMLSKIKDEMNDNEFSGTLIQYIANKLSKEATSNDAIKYSSEK